MSRAFARRGIPQLHPSKDFPIMLRSSRWYATPPDCNFLLDKPPTSEHNLAQVLGPFLFPVRKT